MTEYPVQDSKPGDGEGPIAGAGMPEEAELLFRDWMQSLVAQDVRYNTKAIGLLVREAMVDDRVRSQILEDPAGALRALGSRLELPSEFTVRFFDNTTTVLNVVLPPPAKILESNFERGGELGTGLRERLRSRTADFPTLFHDNWNWNDPGNDLSFLMIAPPG
jgi:hypothetical protein